MTLRERAWNFITSVKLTIFLLAGIAILLILGTWVETKYGTDAALAVIYRSPVMDSLIALLGINQVTCTIKRYPYKPHQAGWLITHVGVLIILVGSIYGRRGQLEGTIVLQEGQTTDNFVMQVKHEDGPKYYEVPLGFRMTLADFAVKTYPGTRMASDYRSHVVAVDSIHQRTFEHIIRVNDPLTYHGFVIAQQSYTPAAPFMGTPATSVLSVLKNPGTPVVFVGFVVLAAGIVIIVFLKPFLIRKFPPVPRAAKPRAKDRT